MEDLLERELAVGRTRGSQASTHPQPVCCSGVGNLRQIPPKPEKNPWLQDTGATGKTSQAAVYQQNILKAKQR